MVAKRKRPNQSVAAATPAAQEIIPAQSAVPVEESVLNISVSDPCVPQTPAVPETITLKQFCFKDPKFETSKSGASSKRSTTWKTLKQIIAIERSLHLQPDSVTYGSIDAPTSFRPAKKYSDISGLPACYTDPQTKLRYATAEEYSRICLLPNDIVAGLLLLRKANNPAA